MTIHRSFLICMAALILSAGSSRASTVLYTDRSLFEAELIAPTTIDFNDQVTPPDLYTNYAPYPGGTVTLAGVTFTAKADAYLYAIDPAYDPSTYGLGDGVVLSWQYNVGADNELRIDLPADTLAVGFDFGRTLDASPIRFRFTLANLESFEMDSVNGAAFAGFISDSPLQKLLIYIPEDGIGQLDRFVFTSQVNSGSTAVPEPASIALTACGLVSIGLYRRRLRSMA